MSKPADFDHVQQLEDAGVRVLIDDSKFAHPDDPEYGDELAMIVAEIVPGGYLICVYLRSIFSAAERSTICRHVGHRLDNLLHQGPELEGWGRLGPAHLGYWLSYSPVLDALSGDQ